MNSLADGAHASLLQKSCSQAICSFCPVHTGFFCLSVSFLCRQRALLASDRNQNGASIHIPILLQHWLWCSSDGRSPSLLVPSGLRTEAVPNAAQANSNHRRLSQLQNEALEQFDIVSTLLITVIWGPCKYHTYVLPLFVLSLPILFAGITKILQYRKKSQANADNCI